MSVTIPGGSGPQIIGTGTLTPQQGGAFGQGMSGLTGGTTVITPTPTGTIIQGTGSNGLGGLGMVFTGTGSGGPGGLSHGFGGGSGVTIGSGNDTVLGGQGASGLFGYETGFDSIYGGSLDTQALEQLLGGGTNASEELAKQILAGNGTPVDHIYIAQLLGDNANLTYVATNQNESVSLDTTLTTNATVNLHGVENAVFKGDGTFNLDGSARNVLGGAETQTININSDDPSHGVNIYAGSGNNTIHGGAGDDVIHSGGGNADISGGKGVDTFVLDGQGNTTIQDLGNGNDKIAVNINGVNNINDLMALIDHVTNNPDGSSTVSLRNGGTVEMHGNLDNIESRLVFGDTAHGATTTPQSVLEQMAQEAHATVPAGISDGTPDAPHSLNDLSGLL